MTTPVLGLPEVTDGQASQGAIHNEALRELMVKTVRVLSRTTTAQPGSPADGDAYILAATHTGSSWGGFSTNQIAHYIGGVWEPYTPAEGWSVRVNDEDVRVEYDGSSWGLQSGLPRWPCVAVSSSTFSVTSAHRGRVLVCDTSASNITLNLLAVASAGNDFVFAVKKKSASNTLTIDPSGAELIDDVTNLALTDDEDSRIVVCDGSEWHSIGGGGSGGGGGLTLPLSDLNAIFKNDADPSKTVKVSLAGLTTATERTATFPDKDGVFAYVDDIPAGGTSSNQLGENSASHNGALYAYYGGYARTLSGLVFVPGGTVLLQDSADNYVEYAPDSGVTANTTGFSADAFPMAVATVGAGSPTTITAVVDKRTWITVTEADPAICGGRLTLETAVPVSTTDQTAKTTIYFTPYKGNRIALYTGSSWTQFAFSEISIALGTLTSGKNYDVFAYNNAGSVALEFSAAWTTDTARADALTLLDGAYVKSSNNTRRYLGTFRTTATTTTEDSAAKRFVWNMYNRVQRKLLKQESTDSWTYSTAAFRQTNASAANQVEVVVGSAEDLMELEAGNIVTNSGATNRSVVTGIGISSTTVNSADIISPASCTVNAVGIPRAKLSRIPSLGYSYYAWLEYGAGADTQTWRGDSGAPTLNQTGIIGQVPC